MENMGLAFAGECGEWQGAGWQRGPRALVHEIEAEPSKLLGVEQGPGWVAVSELL